MFRKQAGDEIASIFGNLMKKNIEKKASLKEEAESDCSYADDVSHLASDMMMVSDHEEERHSSLDQIDEAKDSLGKAHDPKMASLMTGLGKIAASLRGEGEDFAADVVEATAISISKEASEKRNKTASVVSELNKIASDLDRKDKFASDLVRATMKKIAKGSGLTAKQRSQAVSDHKTLKGYAEDFQVALYGVGHDMTMMGKANKAITGLFPNKEKIMKTSSYSLLNIIYSKE